MWVARDKCGDLHLFENEPDRCNKIGGQYSGDNTIDISPCKWRIKNPFGGFYLTGGFIEIDSKLFTELTWEDEPLEVEIFFKNKL